MKLEDVEYIRRTFFLAKQGLGKTSPNPMVGAVLVKNGKVIGEGWHSGYGMPHAEVEAIDAAIESPEGSTLYVNLEPCCHTGKTSPCVDRIIKEKIKTVICPLQDPSHKVHGNGFKTLRDAGIKVRIVKEFENEAAKLNEQFVTFHQLRRPFVSMKWAMTLDGKVATDSGNSRWISNDESRLYVHQLRACHDAILVGIGTVLSDDPQLNVRLKDYDGKQPKRIICDGSLRIPLKSNCLLNTDPADVYIATTENAAPEKVARLTNEGYNVLVLNGKKELTDLRRLFDELYTLGIQSILCEGGSQINAALLSYGFCDRLIAFIAQKLIGGINNHGPIHGWGVSNMNAALPLQDSTIKLFGTDICIEGYVFGLFGRSPNYAEEFRNHNEGPK